MSPIEQFAEGICNNCYRLLKGAGISSDEIFEKVPFKKIIPGIIFLVLQLSIKIITLY